MYLETYKLFAAWLHKALWGPRFPGLICSNMSSARVVHPIFLLLLFLGFFNLYNSAFTFSLISSFPFFLCSPYFLIPPFSHLYFTVALSLSLWSLPPAIATKKLATKKFVAKKFQRSSLRLFSDILDVAVPLWDWVCGTRKDWCGRYCSFIGMCILFPLHVFLGNSFYKKLEIK